MSRKRKSDDLDALAREVAYERFAPTNRDLHRIGLYVDSIEIIEYRRKLLNEAMEELKHGAEG